jgi:DNA-binding winged helix-turn-helix (wHTH) protein
MSINPEDLPNLVAQEGPLNGQRWLISKDIDIGREIGCDITIPSRQVSRYHARITLETDGIVLEDLNSKNGTFCNGQRITERYILQDGDVFQVALAQVFQFVSSDVTLSLDDAQILEKSEAEMKRLHLDPKSRRVWVLDKELDPPLSAAQFRMLDLLYQKTNLVVSRDDIISSVWGEEEAAGVSEQAVDALLRRLRDRLASLDPHHMYIITVRGHGLRLDNPARMDQG